jgi:hypothetical protein
MILSGDTITCIMNHGFENVLELEKRYVSESDEDKNNLIQLTIKGIVYRFNSVRFRTKTKWRY